MNTPFYDEILQLSKNDGRFFMPGHKGAAFSDELDTARRLDITEIDGADNLQNPKHRLLQSQKNIQSLYGSGAALYTASGCSSAIKAMLSLFVPQGECFIMVRNCHVSAIYACALLDLRPEFILEQQNKIDIQQLQRLVVEKKPKAVYITSPDYYGFCANIEQIKELCEHYNIKLLVDNAHGAHLKFIMPDKHPITLGANACCDSLHKTMPALTAGAVLHLKDGAVAEKARQALNMFSSTSPSYLVLCSMDITAGLLLKGAIPFAQTQKILLSIKEKYKAVLLKTDDDFKLTICPSDMVQSYNELLMLMKKQNITPELCNEQYIVFMVSPYNSREDLQRLEGFLGQLEREENTISEQATYTLPQKASSIRSAALGKSKKTKVQQSIGKIAANAYIPCPPGIPALIPGEIINENIIKLLIKSGIFHIDVVE